MRPVRFGLVGYGAWGGHHARAIRVTAGAELAAVVSRSEENRRRVEVDHPDVPAYGDLGAMLAREELDAVDVVLPSDLHFATAREALSAGKHLLLEKPTTPRLDECDEPIALAEAKGLALAVGHELRLSSL